MTKNSVNDDFVKPWPDKVQLASDEQPVNFAFTEKGELTCLVGIEQRIKEAKGPLSFILKYSAKQGWVLTNLSTGLGADFVSFSRFPLNEVEALLAPHTELLTCTLVAHQLEEWINSLWSALLTRYGTQQVMVQSHNRSLINAWAVSHTQVISLGQEQKRSTITPELEAQFNALAIGFR